MAAERPSGAAVKKVDSIGWQLLGTYLGWQAHSVEAPAHFGDLLQCILFPPGLGSVDGVVVERLAGKIHHLVEGETTVKILAAYDSKWDATKSERTFVLGTTPRPSLVSTNEAAASER